ncbi:hypothetical protein [Erysipelothrix rhusiopathiae]|uniref:hypothetical protein n=1 Tax=Erysipelothrix rhusiopathiae TaxID=1648 RepID=UPI00283A949A|nr:hypothetical protein [Erysipelothrix rhusiopathiae]MDV7678447.1 hypothetical protein [Erysipelothrix rhusiopathiae]WMT70147.1 hypothetical protein K0H77_01155 [Erysipelothrix rhusiopathiae]
MFDLSDKVIGYVYGMDGTYENKHYFQDTPENICRFVVMNGFKAVTITDRADVLILNTSMGFIDTCVDQNYLANDILPLLVPMQTGEVEWEPLEFEILEPGVALEKTSSSISQNVDNGLNSQVAVGVGYSFAIVDESKVKNIKLNDSGVVVSVEGKEFTLFKGSTFEDSEKVDVF